MTMAIMTSESVHPNSHLALQVVMQSVHVSLKLISFLLLSVAAVFSLITMDLSTHLLFQ